MSDLAHFAPRSIQLPAVLQADGLAPCFGMIASLSDQGLAFDFPRCAPPHEALGRKARLDFDWQGQHHFCTCLVMHVQGSRALLSAREIPANVLAALHSVNRDNTPPLAARLSILQKQQACHVRFMEGMQAVVDEFFHLLSAGGSEPGPAQALRPIQPLIRAHFTQSYPMYPELRASHLEGATAGGDQAVDMDRVDDWIRRSGLAHAVTEALQPLPDVFDKHYAALQQPGGKSTYQPYTAESVLEELSDLLAPLRLDGETRLRCYELMAQAFRNKAALLYPSMLEILEDLPPELHMPAAGVPDLAQWLKLSSIAADSGGDAASAADVNQLASLVVRLTDNLEAFGERQRQLETVSASSHALVPAMLARDRILGRFLPALPGVAGGPLGALVPEWAPAAPLGSLNSLDAAALDGLYSQLMQPPPVDPGPERLSQASQIRPLMLQAHGLLLEYTLNGLNYQTHPEHPAWVLINGLDALHQGADDRGQFLDPSLQLACSLAMQWLLGQENTDEALGQVNDLLGRINEELLAAQQARRRQHLDRLGDADPGPLLIDSRWCVVRRDDEAIPYEVLGKYGDTWALLNRSATQLLEIPAEAFIDDFDQGRIEEAGSFDVPYLERIANATLTASLEAVHTYTWQDPGTGCLKRSALLDELERRLQHPVSEPPSFCALVEIPTMRPSLSSLHGDELAVMQKQTGDLLHAMLQDGEQCGRLSDVSFLLVFSSQEPEVLAERLMRLKHDMESLHPEWKMIGAAVPLVDAEGSTTPSNVLRRANQICAPVRQHAGFDLSCLQNVPPPRNRIEPLPFDSLFLRCQKIAPCHEGHAAHYEILLGIADDLVPLHTTQSFIVMAEQTGRIQELDAWVLRSALEWMDRNAAGLDRLSGLSVNLSGNSLVLPGHVDAIMRQLERFPHLAAKLILEVTETAAISNLDVAGLALRRLRKLGCRIALDDFGSGYSSYGYLRNLPLDYLKIDGTYIRNLLNDKTDQALTASMVDVAHALGLKVIAEYVDNEATYAWLKNQGVDYVQGYWVHEPAPLAELALH